MNDSLHGYYEAAVGKRVIYIRVHGLASMNNSLCLRGFLDVMVGSDHTFLIVDLADCAGMDSTFMGVLAGAASNPAGPQCSVAVVNAREPLVKLLSTVGLNELLYIDASPFEPPNGEFARLEEQPGEEERLALIRSAHQHLVRVCGKNEEIFGPFLKALEEEMRKKGLIGQGA